MDKKAEIGDNSLDPESLKSFVERIERLQEEKDAIGEDIRSVYDEAKNQQIDAKVLRQVIRRRKQDPNVVQMEEQILRAYLRALGIS